MKFYFGNARTALKILLSELKFSSNDILLLPNLICDVVLHPISDLGIKYFYYKININLEPDWEYLNSLISEKKNVKAILIVHYFGNPNFVEKYLEFSRINNIEIIEDNAHGYGGKYNGKDIGNISNWGISSPRKTLNLPSGGVLYAPHNISNSIELYRFPVFNLREFFKIVLFFFPFWFRQIKSFKFKSIDWSNPELFISRAEKDCKIDFFSKFIIDSTDWTNVQENRSRNWILWNEFAHNNGLVPVFKTLHNGACPWMLPLFSKDINDRNKWLRWGIKYKINITTWPNLPTEIFLEGSTPYLIWERLICIPLDSPPPYKRKYEC